MTVLSRPIPPSSRLNDSPCYTFGVSVRMHSSCVRLRIESVSRAGYKAEEWILRLSCVHQDTIQYHSSQDTLYALWVPAEFGTTESCYPTPLLKRRTERRAWKSLRFCGGIVRPRCAYIPLCSTQGDIASCRTRRPPQPKIAR